jgi:hypothetical protein
MKIQTYTRVLVSMLASASLLLAGCGGDSDDATETPAATDANAAVDSGESESETADASSEESTTDAIVITGEPVDVGETLSRSDKAMQSQDWIGATEALLQLQYSGSIQTDQQSWDYNRRMTVLQEQLIRAADNGDPKARAAIEALRRTRRVQ